jgi:tRNA (uracil-5-)-methyltransferase TRM9
MTAEQPDPPPIQEVYDRIGEHFSKTRAHPWTDVESFLDGRSGTVGLDVGCGNGRHTEPLSGRVDRTVGLDLSRTLLSAARDRATNRDVDATFVHGTATALPFDQGTVDLAVYVAALHHLRTRAERLRSLDELARVLGPEGRALISAWSTAHENFDRETGFDTTVDWTLPDGTTVPRYYHIYDESEFRADLAECDLSVRSVWVSRGNCYATVGPR